jgi:hypothetical protein
VIWQLIYSKGNHESLEPFWQKATHLVTSKGDLLKTGDYTINFIFHDPSSDDLYDKLYSSLPYLLMFSTHVVLECFEKLRQINQNTYSHLMLTAFGVYESLFSKARPRIAPLINKHLDPFLDCIHCGEKLKITKKNGPKAYLTETVSCNHCNLESPLPLYWIFSKAKLKVTKK